MPRVFPTLPDLEKLDRAIAVEIFFHATASASQILTPKNLADVLPTKIGLGLLQELIKRIGDSDYWTNNNVGYYLKPGALDLFLTHNTKPVDWVEEYLNDGGDWLTPDSGFGSDYQPIVVPEQIVRLSVSKIQQAIETVEADDSLTNEQQAQAVSELQAALKIIESPHPNRFALKHILRGLGWLGGRVESAVTSDAISSVIDYIKDNWDDFIL
ncbi:MAG: hypothetical protein COA62_05360 [Rhodobiaceae bacterium]|nr:MAG: hypothetical protein COA62_05360 [Rhodobiaceae bacterium]